MEIGWNAEMFKILGNIERKLDETHQVLSDNNAQAEQKHSWVGYVVNDIKYVIELLEQFDYRKFPRHHEFTPARLRKIAHAIHVFLGNHSDKSPRLAVVKRNLEDDQSWLAFCRFSATTPVT